MSLDLTWQPSLLDAGPEPDVDETFAAAVEAAAAALPEFEFAWSDPKTAPEVRQRYLPAVKLLFELGEPFFEHVA